MADPANPLPTESSKQMAQLVARAWADESFKQRLLSEPENVLREHGVDLAPGTQVNVVEPSEQLLYFVLPPRPNGVTELTDADLNAVAGGIIGILIDIGPTTMSGPSCFACSMF